MKRIPALILSLILIIGLLSACAQKNQSFKLGVGTDLVYGEVQSGSTACDVTVAAVIIDNNGKIVDCAIDSASAKVLIADGFLQDGAAKMTFKSKNDLGDDYNMKTYGNAIAEWYEQAEAFANYCKGKTADEVSGIAVNNEGKPTDSDLLAGCTIEVSDFIKAVVKACKDEQARVFEGAEFSLALQLDAKVDSANDSENNDGKVSYLISTSAVAVDNDGKLCAAVVDAAQPSFSYDDNGTVTKSSYGGTKRELKDNYGMVAYAGAVAEWYQQSASMCEWLEGLTSDEIKQSVGKDGKANDADLLATCTIAVSGDVNQIVRAMAKAK